MTTELTVGNGNQQIDPFEQLGEEITSRAHITGHLLRFTKHGEWKYGQDQDEMPEGSHLLAYMPGLKRGWVKWEDGSPVRHIVGLVAEGYRPPERTELGDMDESEWRDLNGNKVDPWQATFYLVCLDEEGEFYTYTTSSKTGSSAMGELSTAFAKHRRMKPTEIPVIELHARSYKHREYGELFAPITKIVGWSTVPENFAELEQAMRESEQAALEAPTIAAPKIVAPVKPAPIPIKPTARAPAPVKGKPAAKNGPKRKVKF
jgi:hypothetical protein